MRKKNKPKHYFELSPSTDAVLGQPETAEELVKKYGTYEIQPTNDSDNDFPKISQGLPNPEFRKDD